MVSGDGQSLGQARGQNSLCHDCLGRRAKGCEICHLPPHKASFSAHKLQRCAQKAREARQSPLVGSEALALGSRLGGLW